MSEDELNQLLQPDALASSNCTHDNLYEDTAFTLSMGSHIDPQLESLTTELPFQNMSAFSPDPPDMPPFSRESFQGYSQVSTHEGLSQQCISQPGLSQPYNPAGVDHDTPIARNYGAFFQEDGDSQATIGSFMTQATMGDTQEKRPFKRPRRG